MAHLVLLTALVLSSPGWMKNIEKTAPVPLTTAVTHVRQLTQLQPQNQDDVEIAAFFTDPCLDPNNEKLREQKKNYRRAEKGFKMVGNFANGITSAVSAVVPPAGVMTVFGTFLNACGDIFAAGEEYTEVESAELEYAKCIKKDLDKLRKEMTEAFSQMYVKLDQICDKLDQKLDKVLDKLDELKDTMALSAYHDIMASFDDLKHDVRLYATIPNQKAKDQLFVLCAVTKPYKILKKFDSSVIMNLLALTANRNYNVMKSLAVKLMLELAEIAVAGIACFETTEPSKIKGAKEAYRKALDELVGNITQKILEKVAEVKEKVIKEDIKDGFRKAMGKGLEYCMRQDFCSTYVTMDNCQHYFNEACETRMYEFIKYLENEQPWAEWSFAYTNVSSYIIDFIGEAKRFKLCGGPEPACSLYLLWCEIDELDDKRMAYKDSASSALWGSGIYGIPRGTSSLGEITPSTTINPELADLNVKLCKIWKERPNSIDEVVDILSDYLPQQSSHTPTSQQLWRGMMIHYGGSAGETKIGPPWYGKTRQSSNTLMHSHFSCDKKEDNSASWAFIYNICF